jgi:hypothetical protein
MPQHDNIHELPLPGGSAREAAPPPAQTYSPRRHVGQIPPHILRRIYDEDMAFNRRVRVEPPVAKREALFVLLGAAAAVLAALAIAWVQGTGIF